MSDPRYPVGPWDKKAKFTADERRGHVDLIAAAPAAMRAAVAGLSDSQLDTPYREGGWTLRQVAHHLPDSHANAYIRLKLALTEEHPTIKPYDEAAWAKLVDSRETPVETSLRMLETIHERFVILLRSLDDAQSARTLHHPDNGTMTIDMLIGMYSWHGRHHVAHVTSTRERMGW
jgi:hypothetical protein